MSTAKNFDFQIGSQLPGENGLKISKEKARLFADLVRFVGMLRRDDQCMIYVAKFADVVGLRSETRRFIYEQAKGNTESRDA